MRFFVLAGLMAAALAVPVQAEAGPVGAVVAGTTTAVVVTGRTAVRGTVAVGRTAVKGTGAVVRITGRGLVCVATLFHRC
jgi:prophage tail gpP-like protein